jgi:cytochrome P450
MEQLTPEMMGSGEMMIMTDPPLHGAMRRAFNRLFLPRPVRRGERASQISRQDLDRQEPSHREVFALKSKPLVQCDRTLIFRCDFECEGRRLYGP